VRRDDHHTADATTTARISISDPTDANVTAERRMTVIHTGAGTRSWPPPVPETRKGKPRPPIPPWVLEKKRGKPR
jgi:hypothetical protein